MKSFIIALNVAAVSAFSFLGVELDEVVYDSVHATTTFESNDWSLTANWGQLQLLKGGKSAYILTMAFEVGAVDMDDGTEIKTYASIADPDNPGMYETWTCEVEYEEPTNDEDGDGMATTAKDARPSYTITNLYGEDQGTENGLNTWFGDDTDPGVSYASRKRLYCPKGSKCTKDKEDEEGNTIPAKNTW